MLLWRDFVVKSTYLNDCVVRRYTGGTSCFHKTVVLVWLLLATFSAKIRVNELVGSALGDLETSHKMNLYTTMPKKLSNVDRSREG